MMSMSKKSIVKVEPTASEVPAYMAPDVGAGTDELKGYVTVPRLKIIQKQAMAELLARFGVGDVILSPVNALVEEWQRDPKGRPLPDGAPTISVRTVYFYHEWATWNPIQLRGMEPAITYRTTNPGDPIVQKARNPNLRTEDHPREDGLKVRHVEHLNFVLLVEPGQHMSEEVAVVSFSRGSHIEGQKFSSLVRMRRAPIYGMRFDLSLEERKNSKGEWLCFVARNPADGRPWVPEEDYQRMKKLHEDFAAMHASSKLRAAIDDEDNGEEATDTM
jgi:hypothetical protein